MDTSPIPVEALLAHREWVRSVARAVVRDPNAGDDVEQDAWFEALRAPPRQASSLRGWFGAVVRNRARRMGRTAKRRTAREAAVARPEATQSAADLAEIADTHRRVVQAVVELDEPYRQTILLRYFEGLAVDVVAARMNAPLNTARARISRGLAKLRERLAEELGEDDRPWQLALVPLIGRPHVAAGGAGVAVGGGLLMASTTKTAVAVAAVLLLIGGGAFVAARWKADDAKVVAAASDAPAAPPPKPAAPQEKPAPAPRPPRQHAADPAPPAPKADEQKPKAPEETVLQRLQKTKMTADWNETQIVDVMAELAATSGVEIVLAQEAVDVLGKDAAIVRLSLDHEIGANQILDLVTQLKGVQWTVEESRVVIVSPWASGDKRDKKLPVIVPPKWTPPGPIEVTGRVTDQTGAPVAGAQIMQLHAGAKSVGTTDVGGRYDIHLDWPYGSLEARMAGHVRSFAASVSGRNGVAQKMDFALRGAAGSLSVRVSNDAGPLPGVVVSLGPDAPVTREDERGLTQIPLTATTDERGAAVFDGVMPGPVTATARLEGYEDVRWTVAVTAGSRAELNIRLVPKTDLKTKLEKEHISFNFSGASARDVVKFINDAKQLSIVVDPAIAPRVQSAEINLELKDVPIAQALRSLCEQIGGVTYRLQDPIIWIHASDR